MPPRFILLSFFACAFLSACQTTPEQMMQPLYNVRNSLAQVQGQVYMAREEVRQQRAFYARQAHPPSPEDEAFMQTVGMIGSLYAASIYDGLSRMGTNTSTANRAASMQEDIQQVTTPLLANLNKSIATYQKAAELWSGIGLHLETGNTCQKNYASQAHDMADRAKAMEHDAQTQRAIVQQMEDDLNADGGYDGQGNAIWATAHRLQQSWNGDNLEQYANSFSPIHTAKNRDQRLANIGQTLQDTIRNYQNLQYRSQQFGRDANRLHAQITACE